MAKPQSRQALILTTYEQYEQLDRQLAGLTTAQKRGTFPFKGRDRNVRDVLVQLAAWQKMYLDWSEANLADTAKRFMPQPYTWRTSGRLSRRIWEQNQKTTFNEARRAVASLYTSMMAQFEHLTNEELFLKRFYPWTGALSLGDYAAMVAASHYAWANKVLAQYLGTVQPPTPAH